MTWEMLAAVLDGSVVVLDALQARVVVLEPRTEKIWRACTGRTAEDIATLVRETTSTVAATLRDLAGAGLVSPENGRWSQTRVRWI